VNARQVQEGLQELARSFAPILDESAKIVLKTAEARLYPLPGQRGRRHQESQRWGYTIDSDNPLRFRPVLVDELRKTLRVDVYCAVEWQDENAPPTSQDIKIRVWSNEDSFLHDFERQLINGRVLSPAIEALAERMTGDAESGRVIYRCHFDRANENQAGPRHHLQFGGSPREGEYGFIPEVIDLPRLVQPPLDLILMCELIAMNFYPREYLEIRKEASWRSVVYQSQRNLLTSYYNSCTEALQRFEIEESGSLLEHLWNVPLDKIL
jgi:hypothetical protein